MARGRSFVAEVEVKIAGVITVKVRAEGPYGDYDPGHRVASFGQYAVDPRYQGQGIGDLLLAEAHRVAEEAGCHELALDTAQPATGLIAYYEARGFRIVGQADWRPETNYESWIMAKPLTSRRRIS